MLGGIVRVPGIPLSLLFRRAERRRDCQAISRARTFPQRSRHLFRRVGFLWSSPRRLRSPGRMHWEDRSHKLGMGFVWDEKGARWAPNAGGEAGERMKTPRAPLSDRGKRPRKEYARCSCPSGERNERTCLSGEAQQENTLGRRIECFLLLPLGPELLGQERHRSAIR